MDDKIYTSQNLREEMNQERKRRGESALPEINPCRGGNNTVARKDKSWTTVFGFFKKAKDNKDE